MSQSDPRDEHEGAPPRGALAFILLYLLILVLFWVNTYLRLWIKE
ncbi:MAG TPA: hypothetical protein VIA61_08955 [Methylomirabilota bacterium]|jgi:hypothetical protein